MTISPDFIETLKKLAKGSHWEENNESEFFDVQDFCGGNFDDAYEGGRNTGEVELARRVLQELGITY